MQALILQKQHIATTPELPLEFHSNAVQLMKLQNTEHSSPNDDKKKRHSNAQACAEVPYSLEHWSESPRQQNKRPSKIWKKKYFCECGREFVPGEDLLCQEDQMARLCSPVRADKKEKKICLVGCFTAMYELCRSLCTVKWNEVRRK
jgi:hypothetical protein